VTSRSLVSIVDDDESVRESLPDLLHEFGFNAEAFASAQDFLESQRLDETRCLLLDVAMPGMIGPALQQELARQGRAIPIVYITAHPEENLRERLLEAGAAGYLHKPFTESALFEAVTTALRGNHDTGSDTGRRRLNSAVAHPVVFVVDDDISVRESLELMIGHAGWRCETFASATQFLERKRVSGPCCLVLDVRLPDLNGLDLQQRIAEDRGEMPIIFMTGHGDIPMTVKAMKAGAVEFLTKPFSDEVMRGAIAGAVDRSVRAFARETELTAVREAYASLSRREREVMALVVAGHLNKQVAAELGISEITVKAHRGRVMRKMHAGSLPQLVHIAGQLSRRSNE
jgi:FixJ family two-component response regulator